MSCGCTQRRDGVATGGGGASTVLEIIVDPIRWSELPRDFEDGVAGSSMRNVYLTVGTTNYVWYSHAADTPAGVVQTGPDPGDFESALSGFTGTEVEVPQGTITAQQHAVLLAAALMNITGVTAAAARPAANDDGSWDVVVVTELAIATGTRAWADRGNAGLHGGHVYRPSVAGDNPVVTAVDITRPIANRITVPDADDRIWAVQLNLNDTVSTVDSARPRLQYWASTSTTSPASNTLFDFGQLPASQVVAGQVGTIFLTAAQCIAFRNALDGTALTNHWISAHSVTGTFYTAAAVGGGLEGEQIDADIQVEVVGSNDPTVQLATWDGTGELNFPVMLGARLVFDNDPATTGEVHTVWGSFADAGTYPSDVVLPDSVTAQLSELDGLEDARIESMEVFIPVDTGDMRLGIGTGGTQDLDNPVLTGATTVWDAGETAGGTGLQNIAAPTGASTVRVPTTGGMWAYFKGTGATGRGFVGPGPFVGVGNVNQPDSFIRRGNGGGNRGQNPGEVDATDGVGYGSPSTVFESPMSPTGETQPDNDPYLRVFLFNPAISIGVAP